MFDDEKHVAGKEAAFHIHTIWNKQLASYNALDFTGYVSRFLYTTPCAGLINRKADGVFSCMDANSNCVLSRNFE
ncbi:hypothetical protein GCM10007086_03550 [Photobacterium aphoticum]|nr:hypothetical protein GCM10007086_03550 [Photobacterium aphoticum]